MVRYPSDDFFLRYVLEYNAPAFFALLTDKDQRVIKYAVRAVVADLSGHELTSLLMAWKALGNHQEDDWPRFSGAFFYIDADALYAFKSREFGGTPADVIFSDD